MSKALSGAKHHAAGSGTASDPFPGDVHGMGSPATLPPSSEKDLPQRWALGE